MASDRPTAPPAGPWPPDDSSANDIPTRAPTRGRQQYARRRLRTWTAILAVLTTILAIVVIRGQRSERDPTEGLVEAAKKLVLERLKAPSSATFPHDCRVFRAKGKWIVTGEVDSVNTFNAPLRVQWYAVMERVALSTGNLWFGSARLVEDPSDLRVLSTLLFESGDGATKDALPRP